MEKVKECYNIASSDNVTDLRNQVDNFLNKGWELYGNPFSVVESNGNVILFQAVINKI